MLPLGPRLIGQTEQALDALLRQVLEPHDLIPRQWVALQLAAQREPESLTPADRQLRAVIAEAIAARTDAIWASIDPDEAAIAARVLNAVLDQVRAEAARPRS